MALNTDFTSGQILTAAQQNNFPRGLVSVTTAAATSADVSVETVMITSPAFTAVANRYYRLIYVQPVYQHVSGTINFIETKIRLTNISGTQQISSQSGQLSTNQQVNGLCMTVKTLTAGSTVFVATFAPSGGGTCRAISSDGYRAQLIIEDMGST